MTAQLFDFPAQEDRPSLRLVWLKGFKYFWAEYPRKEKKVDAQRAWVQLCPRKETELRPLYKRIMALLECRVEGSWQGREKQHIMLPASFLRGESFDAEDVREAVLGE